MRLKRTRVGFFGVLGGRQVAGAALVMVALLFLMPVSLLSGEPLYQREGDLPAGDAGRHQPLRRPGRHAGGLGHRLPVDGKRQSLPHQLVGEHVL